MDTQVYINRGEKAPWTLRTNTTSAAKVPIKKVVKKSHRWEKPSSLQATQVQNSQGSQKSPIKQDS